MSKNSRPVWSEGLFLRPEHFQQQERYLERTAHLRIANSRPYAWGLTRLALDDALLRIGKFGASEIQGVMPDGSAFSAPDDDPVPVPVEISTEVRNRVVYVAIPLRASRRTEFSFTKAAPGLARYEVVDIETVDNTAEQGEAVPLQVGVARCRFLLQGDPMEDYACIPVARIVERRSDGEVILDKNFIPTVLTLGTAERLDRFLYELLGMLRQRGDALAERLNVSGRGSTAEFSDFLLLQLINRAEPRIAHVAHQHLHHPYDIYGILASLAGELATFSASSRRPKVLPPYQHDDLQASFDPIVLAIRLALGTKLVDAAVNIPLELKNFIHVGVLNDMTLLNNAAFVLAVHADVPAEEIRKHLPMQIKIGPIEQIRDLVKLALPGIEVAPLPVAPRQIPYHAGAVYFELIPRGKSWSSMQSSAAFAMHVGIQYPGLALEFWAVRNAA